MTQSGQTGGGAALTVRVVPRASSDGVAGVSGDAVRIRLRAPPVDGKANEALVRFLAARLGVKARDIAIVAGDRDRSKRVVVRGLPADRVRELLSGGLVQAAMHSRA